MPRLREEVAGGGFGEVARAGRLDQASGSKLRRRSGAGLGDYARPRSPLGLARPDRDRQARRSYAAAVNEVSLGKIGPSFTRIFWPVYLIPPNARQEGEPVICLSQSIQYRRDKPKVQAK
jgi:hypothetical protein